MIIAVSIGFGFVVNAKQMKFSLIVLVFKSNTLAKRSACGFCCSLLPIVMFISFL